MSLTAVKVRGPFRGVSGYDHHVREFVREFVRRGIAVQLTDMPDWGPSELPPESRDPLFESLGRAVNAPVSLQFCMPHQLILDDRVPTVNFTMFEATRVAPVWVEASRRCRLTVLPTESSRRAWMRSGAPVDRLRLCPLGVRGSLFETRHEPWPVDLGSGRRFSDYRYRFLNISAWGSRKNLPGLLRTWLRATTAADDAALLLKVGCHAPGSRTAFNTQLELAQQAAGKSLAEAAPIHVLYDTLSDDEMARVYAAATHYWSMSHGEGWDLPMTEAIASGLTPVAPDHSAYRAYLDPSIALLIPCGEVPASRFQRGMTGGLFAGANWWKPDERAAAAMIRDIIDQGLAPATPARDRILRDFSWERSTDRLLEILEEAVAEPAPAKHRRWSLPWRRP